MNTVDEVKGRLDIVDIIGGYVDLRHAGRNFRAICPFHQEKTPSFFVFPERQTWKCFGCGAGGDLLSFVMRKEGVDFSEALRMLAAKAGVNLERKKDSDQDRAADSLHHVNEAAAQYYHDSLLNDAAARGARDYVKKRGLGPETVTGFQLGFSPGEGLKKHLLERGYDESDLLMAGLIREQEGRTYEFFRHRLMFPIRDIRGRVVGFGGRTLDDSSPKYLNSPQTAVFDKGSILYGIDRAKGPIRERQLAIIVEGYMDVVTAHQHGAGNVVASMGTALTEKQISVLAGLTRSFAFALDRDVAGDAATLRGIEVCRRSLQRRAVRKPYGDFPDYAEPSYLGTRSGLRGVIKIIGLPEGKDPDALIRDDPELWQDLVDQALPLMDHLIAVLSSKLDLSRPEGKSQASEQLLPMIAELEDDVEREFYLGRLANLLGVSERTLAGMAARMHGSRREKAARREPQPILSARYGDPLEEYCLSLLLQHPELRDKSEELLAEHFERSENREVFTAWRDASNPDELGQSVGVDLQDHLEALTGRPLPPAGEKEWEKALADSIRSLEERRLRLQEGYLTSEGVSMVSESGELGPAELASIQQRTVEVDAQLVNKMRERSGPGLPDRGNQ